MHKTAFLLCLLMAPVASAKDPPTVQFVDRTHVDVPRQAGPFALVSTQYDAESFSTGVSTLWKPAGAPESLRLDVFVYPLGQSDEAQAVGRSMDEVDGGVAEYARRGVYKNVKTGARTPFVIVRPEPSMNDDGKTPRPAFDPTPKEEVALTPTSAASDDPIMQAVATSLPPTNSHGLREAISLEIEGSPKRSAAFAFYRNLFLFKLRISVAAQDMSQEDFDRLADDAARQIIPRIEVVNYGTCGNVTLNLPPDGKEKQSKAEKERQTQEGAAQLIRAVGRLKRDNCASGPGTSGGPEKGSERTVITYPAGTWK